MTYTVLVETLNPTHSLTHCYVYIATNFIFNCRHNTCNACIHNQSCRGLLIKQTQCVASNVRRLAIAARPADRLHYLFNLWSGGSLTLAAMSTQEEHSQQGLAMDGNHLGGSRGDISKQMASECGPMHPPGMGSSRSDLDLEDSSRSESGVLGLEVLAASHL